MQSEERRKAAKANKPDGAKVEEWPMKAVAGSILEGAEREDDMRGKYRGQLWKSEKCLSSPHVSARCRGRKIAQFTRAPWKRSIFETILRIISFQPNDGSQPSSSPFPSPPFPSTLNHSIQTQPKRIKTINTWDKLPLTLEFISAKTQARLACAFGSMHLELAITGDVGWMY